MGFVTVMSSDAVADHLAEMFGIKLLVDHQVSNFWKLGNQFFGLDEFNFVFMLAEDHGTSKGDFMSVLKGRVKEFWQVTL